MNETPIVCKYCHTPVAETDNYCRVCGKSLRKGYSFMFTHTGIIVMAFLLGPLALPCVWLSKVISPVAKWIYTALLLIISYYFIVVCWRTFQLISDYMQVVSAGGLSF
jgi:uncharacterized membrane protein